MEKVNLRLTFVAQKRLPTLQTIATQDKEVERWKVVVNGSYCMLNVSLCVFEKTRC